METKKLDLGLGEYEELFMIGEERLESYLPKVQDIPLSEIDDFPGHPFQIRLELLRRRWRKPLQRPWNNSESKKKPENGKDSFEKGCGFLS